MLRFPNFRDSRMSILTTAYNFGAWILIMLNLGNAVDDFIKAGFQNYADTGAILSFAVSIVAAVALGELTRARSKQAD